MVCDFIFPISPKVINIKEFRTFPLKLIESLLYLDKLKITNVFTYLSYRKPKSVRSVSDVPSSLSPESPHQPL